MAKTHPDLQSKSYFISALQIDFALQKVMNQKRSTEYIVFKNVFKISSVLQRQPLQLFMLSWSFFYHYSQNIVFKTLAVFLHNHHGNNGELWISNLSCLNDYRQYSDINRIIVQNPIEQPLKI